MIYRHRVHGGATKADKSQGRAQITDPANESGGLQGMWGFGAWITQTANESAGLPHLRVLSGAPALTNHMRQFCDLGKAPCPTVVIQLSSYCISSLLDLFPFLLRARSHFSLAASCCALPVGAPMPLPTAAVPSPLPVPVPRATISTT